MIRLLLPVAGTVVFFGLSFVTVRVFHPRDPKRFFLIYAVALAAASAAVYRHFWPMLRIEDAFGLAADTLLQLLACFTIWNSFYSLLWGFSGGLMYDLYNNPPLRARDALVRSYEGDGDVDRMMARRLPNLTRGGWLTFDGRSLGLTLKGRAIARGTLLAYRFFSLGMGGGIK
jgi:hypothetical protein